MFAIITGMDYQYNIMESNALVLEPRDIIQNNAVITVTLESSEEYPPDFKDTDKSECYDLGYHIGFNDLESEEFEKEKTCPEADDQKDDDYFEGFIDGSFDRKGVKEIPLK